MMRPPVLACCALLAVIGASTVAGCYDATQIELEITTDIPCSETVTIDTAILVGSSDDPVTADAPFLASTSVCLGGKIGSLVLVPSDARNAGVRIQVVAAVGVQASAEECRNGGPACVIARRRLRYVPHRGLHLPIALTGACVGQDCSDPNATCIRGACAIDTCADPAACSDDSLLAASDGGAPTTIAALPSDAGAQDAASDAGAVACDAGDALVGLCYRGRTITVPCYVASRYLSNGAVPGSCP